MRERMRQTKRVRKFAFEWFLFITVGLLICHVSVIQFKMGDNWRLLNGRGAKPKKYNSVHISVLLGDIPYEPCWSGTSFFFFKGFC